MTMSFDKNYLSVFGGSSGGLQGGGLHENASKQAIKRKDFTDCSRELRPPTSAHMTNDHPTMTITSTTFPLARSGSINNSQPPLNRSNNSNLQWQPSRKLHLLL